MKIGRRTVGVGEEAGHVAPGDLSRLEAPLLVVASTGDRIAPPRSVHAGWRAAGSATRKYVLFGDSRNDPARSTVFGHNDLMCSRTALEQVWPLVADWLETDEAELNAAQVAAPTDAGAACPASSPSP